MTSTASETGRIPHATSRRCIHSGDEAEGSNPVTVRIVNNPQALRSSLPHSTGAAPEAGTGISTTNVPGSVNATP
ncbi:unannotated protein [freshwater metagenome]|uniref:Unannotated protein n=1 Tax=freshwater metagenome TaxID=449393 RepID=A0A6J7IYX5_9ZZZZ